MTERLRFAWHDSRIWKRSPPYTTRRSRPRPPLSIPSPWTTAEQAQWFHEHQGRFPVVVAEVNDRTVGWAAISPWSTRCAYSDTAETSTYVKSGHRGEGIGRALKAAIIEEARRRGFHVLIAQITEGGDASRHLNASFGFEHMGTLREVGKKFGAVLDVHLYQLILSPDADE